MDFIDYLIKKHNISLSEQQQKAVLNIDGPILLLAVPGGGKTTVIVSRCANLVINHGVIPQSILTLTFSKASAMDMKHRFHKAFGDNIQGEVHFSTIHSFCYFVLKNYAQKMRLSFPIIIEDEKAEVTKSQMLRQLYQKRNSSYLSDDKLEELSNAICYVKNMMLSEKEIVRYKTDIKNFFEIFQSYEALKHENNLIDFDDMLTKTLELFDQDKDLVNVYRNKYKYINVDESQDTSYLQHQILKCLANPRNNIFMVGDEDQSIYAFRAAFPKALMDFEKTYPGAQIYLMENNYRSTQSIVNAANKFIKQNNERYDKNMFSERKDGTPVKYISFQNKNDQYIHLVSKLKDNKDFSSIAVLYRNNVSAIPVADALSASAIPFYLREAKTHFFRHWVTMDIISFFDLSNDAANTGAFRQIYYKMNAFLSKVMFEYSVKNRMPNKTLFDTLLEYPDLTEKQYDKILAIKKNFQKMSKLNVHEAIEFIVNALGYGEYINKQSSDATDSTDGLNQIISSLKSIAARTDSVQSFKDRLERLQQIMQNAKFNKGKNAVTLSTVHSSKGLEFDCVYMIDLFDGQFPSVNSIREAKSGNRSLMEEEVRLFYVGATRARHQLELMASNTLDGNRVKPSRFIELFLDIPKKKQTVIADSSKWEIELDDYIDQGPISAKNLYLEMPVAHKMFGLGNIRSINWKTDILEIFFVDIGIKIFSLSTCINADLLHTLEIKT